MHCESSTSKGLCTVGFWQKNTQMLSNCSGTNLCYSYQKVVQWYIVASAKWLEPSPHSSEGTNDTDDPEYVYNAGNSAKKRDFGTSRFEELINASSNVKTPILTIFSQKAQQRSHKSMEAQKLTLNEIKDQRLDVQLNIRPRNIPRFRYIPRNARQ